MSDSEKQDMRLSQQQAYDDLLALQGKVQFSITADELRSDSSEAQDDE